MLLHLYTPDNKQGTRYQYLKKIGIYFIVNYIWSSLTIFALTALDGRVGVGLQVTLEHYSV